MKSIAEILEYAGEIAGKTVSKSPEKFAEAKAIVHGLRRNFNKGYKRAQVDIDHKTGQRTTTIIDEDEPRQMEFPFEDDIPF